MNLKLNATKPINIFVHILPHHSSYKKYMFREYIKTHLLFQCHIDITLSIQIITTTIEMDKEEFPYQTVAIDTSSIPGVPQKAADSFFNSIFFFGLMPICHW